MPSQQDINKLAAIIGQPISTSAGTQFKVNDAFPFSTVHYEIYKKHVELHLEPVKAQPYVRLFAEYLRRNLPDNEKGETVSRSFCHYAYQFKESVEGWDDVEHLGKVILQMKSIIDPLVNGFLTDVYSVNEIAAELAAYYEQLQKSQPYHINVIDELHANENAHTRILIKLLQYSFDGKLTVLESFLSMLPEWNESGLDVGTPRIEYNVEYIDGLIESRGEYAVIIENKIHWASDQDKQLERYVDTVISHGVPEDKIWVVYLTSDGTKTPEAYSLTEKVQKIIGDKYAPLSYRHDILPWLKEQILPTCTVREEWLISALRQYIDHLEGLLGIRENQVDMQKKIEKKVLKSVGLGETSDLRNQYEALKELEARATLFQQIVSNKRNAIEEGLISSFKKLSEEFFSRIFPDKQFLFINHCDLGYYQIYPKDWPSNIHLEWIPLQGEDFVSGTRMTLDLHIENDKEAKTKDFIARLKENTAYRDLLRAAEFHIGNRTYYSYSIELGRPFYSMTIAERQNKLAEAYKAYLPLMDIVYKELAK